MKATGVITVMVLFIMLHEENLTFESVNEILKCNHSSESSWGAVYYAVQCGSNFYVYG